MKQHAFSFFLIALLCALPLSSCGPNREAQDAKLLSACTTVLKSLYDQGDVIEVKEKTFMSEPSPDDTNLRTVKIFAYYSHNQGAIEEKNYSCSFEENNRLLGYAPRFYRMDKDGTKYGNYDGTIQGDLQEMIKINQAMVAALH